MSKHVVSLLFVLLLLPACTRKVLRLSVSEIERPLFPPSKNWQVSFGCGIRNGGYFSEKDWPTTHFSFMLSDRISMFPLLGFQWPSLHFGERVEWNAPTTLRFHLLKNIESKDGIERITGCNIAMVNEVAGLSYSMYRGFLFFTRHSINFKTILSKTIWFTSNPEIYLMLPSREPINTHLSLLLRIPFSLGYQINEQWSCKAGITPLCYYDFYPGWERSIRHSSGSEAYIFDADIHSQGSKSWAYTVKRYDLDLQIPLQTRYVFNYNWEATFQIEENVFTKNYHAVAAALWVTYTW